MTGWLHEAAIAVQDFIELGGWVVGVLLALSVLAGAAVLWKLWHLSHMGIGRHAALREALAALNDGDRATARAALRRAGTPLAALGLRAIASNDPAPELRLRLHAEGDALIGRAEGGLRMLDAISQVAPLLGLFGTVLGMIEAFRALQGAGASVDPSILAGGIWVALMTTAVGLAIAMPVSLILSAFEARIAAERRVADLMVETLCGPALPETGQAMAKAPVAASAGMAGNG
ncbi:MotA/TolQ/ExbB proton channel family protein [Szabonella alba]|uniref:MotA/TolQ/ExbB proton channel family protein n=1 Tax=Szabonella alba TaxID=2804194 RepID=A0A8K0V708_9RHOB|nr:MotA/TolQ/ExbB proton channel family protein [Szabonella alba]MBL4916914.1 MotA/TolQ/ExbB proton channel family protein [Szabonella alba]